METKKKTSTLYVKESIIIALYQLMLEKPFSEIKIQEITKKAGVSRISYYRNFKSKEDILSTYMYYETSNFHQNHKGEEEEKFLTHLLEHLKGFQDKFELLYKNNLSYLFAQHIYSWCGPKDNTSDHTAYLMSAASYAIYGYIDEWIKRGMKDDPKDIAKELVKDLETFHFKISEVKR